MLLEKTESKLKAIWKQLDTREAHTSYFDKVTKVGITLCGELMLKNADISLEMFSFIFG